MSKTVAELLDLYDAAAPLEEAYTIPAPWYLDERVEQAEREQVFGRNWIAVGRLDQVADRGAVFYGRDCGRTAGNCARIGRRASCLLQRMPASRGGRGQRALRNGAASALSLSWLDVWAGRSAEGCAGVCGRVQLRSSREWAGSGARGRVGAVCVCDARCGCAGSAAPR